jgi:hypothetical protein
MQSQNKRRFIFAAIFVIFVLLIGYGLLHHPAKRATTGDKGTYVDPLSHEAVSNPPGKSPDIFGQNPNSPVYLGFDKLLNHGLTFTQLTNLKTAFLNYSLKQPNHISEISIDVDHITSQYNPSSGDSNFYVLFNGVFDRKTVYKAKVQYSGLTDVHLYLMDPANKVIFDSGVINPGE